MNFRPTCFKNCKEGAPFRRENTHLGQVHDGDMDVTLTSNRDGSPGVRGCYRPLGSGARPALPYRTGRCLCLCQVQTAQPTGTPWPVAPGGEGESTLCPLCIFNVYK